MNNTSKILIALAVGAAAGAIVTLLYAPTSGGETRKNIRDQSKKIVDAVQRKYRNTNEKFNDIKEGIQQSYDQLREKVLS